MDNVSVTYTKTSFGYLNVNIFKRTRFNYGYAIAYKPRLPVHY